LDRIYQALILGTRDYVRKNGFEKVVVGLSGGIDSSLVAAIACAAVGRENVVGITMPSMFSSPETRADAKRLAENLGIRFIEVPVVDIFKAYGETLKKEFAGQKFDVAEENLQARIRGNILMAFSNKFGWLVLTTGNKSEIAVGYCTLYGDMSGGFAVIKDVPKTKVYELAGLVNRVQGEVIPETVMRRAPSAELRENQKDQDSLPPYDVLDPLLRLYVEEHGSLAAMNKRNQDSSMNKKIISLVDQSEYKRRQSPPGIKITARAFGKDWRLPITNGYKEF
ncbi:MAG: NAD(+) synthase, partial [Candidatus Omnitrophota bacterium]